MSLCFVRGELLLNLVNTNDLGDAFGELGGEGGAGNEVFVGSLGIGGDEAYTESWGCIEREWEVNLGWLEALLVCDVLLCVEV